MLPAEYRRQDDIRAGDVFEVERVDRGQYRFVHVRTRPNRGLVDWLLRCPDKGYFVPVESDSTDSL